MNKLFYIIYNSYYKHGKYKKDNPPLTVWGIFLVFFFSFSYSIAIIIGWINPLYYRLPKINKPMMLLVTVFFGTIVYFLFYHNKRYHKIYETYKDDVFLNSIIAKYLGFFIAFFIILSPIFLGLIRNKIFLGHWI